MYEPIKALVSDPASVLCEINIPCASLVAIVEVYQAKADENFGLEQQAIFYQWNIEEQPVKRYFQWGDLYIFYLSIERVRIRNSFYPLLGEPIQFNYQWRLL